MTRASTEPARISIGLEQFAHLCRIDEPLLAAVSSRALGHRRPSANFVSPQLRVPGGGPSRTRMRRSCAKPVGPDSRDSCRGSGENAAEGEQSIRHHVLVLGERQLREVLARVPAALQRPSAALGPAAGASAASAQPGSRYHRQDRTQGDSWGPGQRVQQGGLASAKRQLSVHERVLAQHRANESGELVDGSTAFSPRLVKVA
jgi:hypothetical protein